MNIQTPPDKKLFVLDTNVLMHDPAAIFRFQEHDIFIPMIVLEELDHAKKGLTEVARNVRQVSRFLDELIRDANQQTLNDGLPLSRIEHGPKVDAAKGIGRLYFQTSAMTALLPESMPGNIVDNCYTQNCFSTHQRTAKHHDYSGIQRYQYAHQSSHFRVDC